MRTLFWTILSLGLCGCLAAARADLYQLADGASVSGDMILFNAVGATVRTPSDNYTNIVWPMFSQATLKQLVQQNPKIAPLAGPFIETPPQAKTANLPVHEVTRLERPPEQSLLAALLSSSVGFIALLLLYAANVYAAYEIALVRARPLGLVMGAAAVLPVLAPIVFLSMPVRRETEPAAPVQGEQPSYAVPGAAAPVAESVAAAGIHIAPATGAKGSHPEAQVFQRGQFMFNRRFFETKFSGFFASVRRPAERDLVLVVKTARAQLTVQRITRIATNEAYLEVLQGGTRQEIMVPFADVLEIQVKHKDA